MLLYECPEIITALAALTASSAETVAKESLLCLVNLSAENEGARVIFEKVLHTEQLHSHLVPILISVYFL